MSVRVWLFAGIAALCPGACAREVNQENDPRFHPLLLAVAKGYEDYGVVDYTLRFAPMDCFAPEAEPLRLSASKDAGTHGQKLYFLYAWDAASYLETTRKDFHSKKSHVPPAYEQRPAEQILVKQSWACVPAKEDRAEGRSGRVQREGKFELMTTGEQKDLFMMVRLPGDTPGTDRGWVYGTVSPDGKQVTSSGRVPSCMACHETAGKGRLFGLMAPRGAGK